MTPIKQPINGILDLHTFQPREVKNLVSDYIELCREKNILFVRIIHGKGKGVLWSIVHSVLMRMPEVESFQQADDGGSNWGATVVKLIKKDNNQ